MPKFEKNRDEHLFPKPYSKGVEGGSSSQQCQNACNNTKNADGEDNHKLFNCANSLSTQNVLKRFMKYHKTSIQNCKSQSKEVLSKVNETSLSMMEKDCEITQLKQRVDEQDKLLQVLEEERINIEKDAEALKQLRDDDLSKYVTLEVGYDQDIVILNNVIEEQSKKLQVADEMLKSEIVAQRDLWGAQKNEMTSKFEQELLQLDLMSQKAKEAYQVLENELQHVIEARDRECARKESLRVEMDAMNEMCENTKRENNVLSMQLLEQAELSKDYDLKTQQLTELEQVLLREQAKYKNEREQQQEEIQLLQAKFERSTSDKEHYATELKKSKEQVDELQQKLQLLELESANNKNDYENQRAKHVEQLNALTAVHKQELLSVQKNYNDIVKQDKEKSKTIAELEFKIGRLGSVLEQPIAASANIQEADELNSPDLAEATSNESSCIMEIRDIATSVAVKNQARNRNIRTKAGKRSNRQPISSYQSDFESNSDGDYVNSKELTGLPKAKRSRLFVKSDNDKLFANLKK
ncbi:maker341 [Drosophila busckii]|uniref:Maker341 n=1 Tax=Drosophila busckii TaxID=30019 RepID=A0A0M3QZJ0_DROBS|nr:maker341 [Drosophila busckii]